jgi:hypothetical protein
MPAFHAEPKGEYRGEWGRQIDKGRQCAGPCRTLPPVRYAVQGSMAAAGSEPAKQIETIVSA